MEERFFFLLKTNSIFIAVLRLKLWFSGFDTIRFQTFKIFLDFAHFSRFFVLPPYHVNDNSFITHWLSK